MEEELTKENEEREGGEIEEKRKPPIYLIELVLVPLPWVVLADFADLLSLTGILSVISWVFDILAMGISTIWLIIKGRRAEWMMISNMVEFIPGIDILPWRTVTLLILYLKDKKAFRMAAKLAGSPAMEKMMEISEKVSQKIPGK